MNASDIVETTLDTSLTPEQARLINGFLVLSTPGYTEPTFEITVSGTQQRLIDQVRNLAMQGLKAPAIAIELDVKLNMVYIVARQNEITLNTTRGRITSKLVEDAISLLRDEVSVIGAAKELDISPASLERIINGTHPILTPLQRVDLSLLVALDYTLIR